MPSIANTTQHARLAPLSLSHVPASVPVQHSGAAAVFETRQQVSHAVSCTPPSPGLVLPAQKNSPSLASIATARNARDVCPITQESLSDIDVVVVAQDGYAYDREALRAWLATSNLSPMTRLPMPETVEALIGPTASLSKSTDAALGGFTGRTLRRAIPHLVSASVGVCLLQLAHPQHNLSDMMPAPLLAACAGASAGILLRRVVGAGIHAAGRLSPLHTRQALSDLEMHLLA